MMIDSRNLGKLAEFVSPIGFGCAAIGGYYTRNGQVASRGTVDDAESIRAIHAALHHNITLFDVANIYGAGHAEQILGKALSGRRQEAILQVKFGASFDEVRKAQIDYEGELTSDMIWNSVKGSLRRLQTDTIDILQLQTADYPTAAIPTIIEQLNSMVLDGIIRAYSFGTPDVSKAELFAQAPHCATIITGHNLLMDAADMLAMLEKHDVALLAGIPLFLGFLTGKYDSRSVFPVDDQRHAMNLASGGLAQMLGKISLIQELLTSDNRTMVQAALAWLWTRHHLTIPVPGFKTVSQVEEAAGALAKGKLPVDHMTQIESILGR